MVFDIVAADARNQRAARPQPRSISPMAAQVVRLTALFPFIGAATLTRAVARHRATFVGLE